MIKHGIPVLIPTCLNWKSKRSETSSNDLISSSRQSSTQCYDFHKHNDSVKIAKMSKEIKSFEIIELGVMHPLRPNSR